MNHNLSDVASSHTIDNSFESRKCDIDISIKYVETVEEMTKISTDYLYHILQKSIN